MARQIGGEEPGAGQHRPLHVAGGVGLVSTAEETALVRVADTGERAAVLMLFELQAAVPVVFAVTAFTGATALALLRTRLLPHWLGVAGLDATAVSLSGRC